jgi:filamentous hemagglutinin family protein
MEQSWKTLFLLTFFCTFGLITSAKAQITPDNSLGAETSTVAQPNQPINGIPINQIDQINGGARRGGNLFHSFGEFNVNAGRAAYFSNPAGVANILTRVTGVNRSNILGTLGVLGNANLFLINPNGIFFGPNASLDNGGSFLGSSANSLIFDNGFEFSATNPQAPPLLTVNIPIGLGFRDNPGEIRVQGFGQTNGLGGAAGRFNNPTLEVSVGENLTLVGGNVNLDGGVLQATGGRVQLGGLTAPGTVGINANQTLSFPDGVQRGDVSLTNRAGINVIANQLGGGSIDINARNIGISGESLLTDGIFQNLGTVNNSAGNITLNAAGETRIDQSRIENNVNSGTIANSGNFDITTGSFVLTNQAQLDTSNYGQGDSGDINIKADSVFLDNALLQTSNAGRGNGGNITVQAKDTISLAKTSLIFSNIGSSQGVPANGNVGNILLDARVVSLTDSSQLQAGFFANAEGNPGTVSIRARESVSFTGLNTGIFANVDPGGLGNGSDVQISGESFSLNDRAVLITSTSGRGNAGDIAINVGSLSATNGSQINSITSGQGNAGDIAIDVGSLSVTNGAQVLARNASGEGNAGSVTIKARDTVTLAGFDGNGDATVASDVAGGGVGNGNSINITARSVAIKDQAIVAASIINGRGQDGGFAQAGDVNITATDKISVDNSEVFSEVGSTSRGNGGNINISAPSFSIDNGGLLGTNIREGGEGNAGNINIKTESLSLKNGSQLVASTFGSRNVANAGNITVSSQNIELRDGGKIVAAAERGDNAGNIDVSSDRITISVTDPTLNVRFNPVAQQFVELYTNEPVDQQESGIFVNSRGTGRGGNLSITGNTLSLDRGIISASTNSGNGGNITLSLQNFLRLRNESLISTSAGGQQGGNGGDITINAPFIVAFPRNNDIIANSVSGSGGGVTTNAIRFGIIPRTRADLERLGVPGLNPRNLPTSDITAFSEQNSNFRDNVQVTSPDVDPSRGLVELPETVTDPTQKIAQSPCQQGFGNEFVVTGRGGLPTTPNETLNSDNVRVDLLQPVASSGNSRSATIKPATTVTATRVPAQGWIFNDKGQVVLTAYDPTNTGSQRPFSTAACPAR